MTALHTLNNKGVQPNGCPWANNHCSTRYDQNFDSINIHTLIRKLLIKFIANYIKGCTAYTAYRNHTSRQRQFKTGVSQGGVLSHTLFNIYTTDLSSPSAPVQVMANADDIIITSTRTSMSYIQPYLHKFLPGQNKTISY